MIVPDDEYADAEFRSNRISGFAGCGNYDAAYRTGGRLLLVSMVAFTSASCGDVTDAFQSTYLSLLGQARWYNAGANSLIIRGPDRTSILEFDAAPPNPLLGSWVVESYATTPGTPIAPIAGTDLSVVFRFHRVGGSSGCNTFQGPYTQDGNLAGIGPLATTQMACAEDVMAQETAFLKALQGIGRIEPRGQRLELTDLTGKVVVDLDSPVRDRAGTEPESECVAVRGAHGLADPDPVAVREPVRRPDRPYAGADPDTDRGADTFADPGCDTSRQRLAGSDGGAAGIVAAPGQLRAGRVDDRLSGELVHPAGPVHGGLPLLQSGADHGRSGPRRSDHGHRDHGGRRRHLCRSADGGDQPDRLERAHEPGRHGRPACPPRRIQATSTAGIPEFPADSTRYGYLIDIGGRGVWIQTGGTVGDAAFTTRMSVVDLMASQSTIVPPIPS